MGTCVLGYKDCPDCESGEYSPIAKEKKVAPTKKYYANSLTEALEEIDAVPQAPGLRITVEMEFGSEAVTEAINEDDLWSDDPLEQVLDAVRSNGKATITSIEKL